MNDENKDKSLVPITSEAVEYCSLPGQVNQIGNVVYGLQAGRDINITEPAKQTHMGTLIAKFKHEKENDLIFNSMVDKLQHFCSPVDTDEIVGAEAKLLAGEYKDFVDFALKTKEQYSKKLASCQFYESAQHIHACILAKIYTIYHNQVYPLIKNGAEHDVVLSAIQDKIIGPLENLLEENVLELYADEINGAIYYLTGNCHIKWV